MLKCEFGKTSLVYLGHIVGGGDLRIDPNKVEAIVNWPTPKSIIEVRSFLGAAQYWRKFISNFSTIAIPIHAVISMKRDFQWGGKQQKAFESLKKKHGKPIAFHSETSNGAVVNYPTNDKELYALVQSVKKWKHYLMGKETIVHTNHQPLQYLQSQSKLQQSR
eukprot:PITA_25824